MEKYMSNNLWSDERIEKELFPYRDEIGQVGGDEWMKLCYKIRNEMQEEVEKHTKSPLQLGTKLYGYCNGFFHADYYGEKIVVAFGENWIVAIEEDGYPNFAYFEGRWKDKMLEFVEEWKKEI